MNTPVALIIFNRPDKTQKVFDEIAKAKPGKLFVIADGPRKDHPGDNEKCIAARKLIDQVNWDCEVFKNYSDTNLGCGRRPATGISWVFENVEQTIILEDDCIPSLTFFRYCEEMLERYKDDERVMTICGMKTIYGEDKPNPFSYSFRLMGHFWGWATWRRAWQHYDFKLKLWGELRNSSWLLDILENPMAVEYYVDKFDRAYNCNGNIDYWDYQWLFTCLSQKGLSIVPNKNLINNIGFGEDATHTKSIINHQKFVNLAKEEMVFPLKHPPYVVFDKGAHIHRFKEKFAKKTLWQTLNRWAHKIVKFFRLV